MKKNIWLIIILTIISAKTTYATISLERYCQDGYYQIPGEKKCSRAPNCGGYGYDELNTADKMPNPQSCTTSVKTSGEISRACDGWVPLCCYEMVRNGDYTKCIGYWERLWCNPSLCQEAQKNGASDEQCGGCQCGHAWRSYCPSEGGVDRSIPLEVRLGQQLTTQTPPAQRPTPTTQPNHQTTLATITPRPTIIQSSPTTTNHLPITTIVNTSNTITNQHNTISFKPSSVNHEISSPQPSLNFTLPNLNIKEKINLPKIEATITEGLNSAEQSFNTLKELDSLLETSINNWLNKIITYIVTH